MNTYTKSASATPSTTGTEDEQQRELQRWLAAEEDGDEAVAERALFELLSRQGEALPHADAMERARAAPRSIASRSNLLTTWFRPRLESERVFVERVVRRIELERKKANGWTFKKIATTLAGALLVCWGGVLVYAVILGLDPTSTTTLGGAVSFLLQGLAQIPAGVTAGISLLANLLLISQSALQWAHSPLLLGFGLVALLCSGAALVGLGRLLPSPPTSEQARVQSSPLRSSSMGAL